MNWIAVVSIILGNGFAAVGILAAILWKSLLISLVMLILAFGSTYYLDRFYERRSAMLFSRLEIVASIILPMSLASMIFNENLYAGIAAFAVFAIAVVSMHQKPRTLY
jgi:hypothetical protein